MKVVDLTQTIEKEMPVYPGTGAPEITVCNHYETDGFRESFLQMTSHTGTHMDAPYHLREDWKKLDTYPAEQFVGKGLVIDCADLADGAEITMERIECVREKADQADFLLFYTGWDKKWGQEAYFGNYPYISEEVARYMLESGKKGVGLDVIGLDPIADETLRLHWMVLSAQGFVIIENLKNLHLLGKDLFLFCALPLKYKDADGAPVRAVAILEDDSRI